MPNTTTQFHTALTISPENHTMGASLRRYTEMKMHQLIRENQHRTVYVSGKSDRTLGNLSVFEKSDKLFNWKRPTAEISGDAVLVRCFPGQDYVYHYANLISTYYHIIGRDIPVSYVLPSEFECQKAIYLSNLDEIPITDIVILGYVEQLSSLLPTQEWSGSGDFLFKVGMLNGKTVMLLGCKHSYWGDISGRLVEAIAQRGTEAVIYIGKLGSLNPQHEANTVLATGNMSFVNGKYVHWENIFGHIVHSSLAHGIHYTLPSVIQETKHWCDRVREDFSFVDPEIGHMADAANRCGIQFSYLHIVSDNLCVKHSEDLSNERNISVLSKRAYLLNLIKEILVAAI